MMPLPSGSQIPHLKMTEWLEVTTSDTRKAPHTNRLSGCNLHQACLSAEACPDKGFGASRGRHVANGKHLVHRLSAFWDLGEAALVASSRLWGVSGS